MLGHLELCAVQGWKKKVALVSTSGGGGETSRIPGWLTPWSFPMIQFSWLNRAWFRQETLPPPPATQSSECLPELTGGVELHPGLWSCLGDPFNHPRL